MGRLVASILAADLLLMTTFTTVVGLLPMTLAFGFGTEANKPLPSR